jgi:hypothetical protein
MHEIGPEDRTDGSQAAHNGLRVVPMRGGEDVDEKSSWMRVVITIAIDWRFVLALVILVLTLLLK